MQKRLSNLQSSKATTTIKTTLKKNVFVRGFNFFLKAFENTLNKTLWGLGRI